MPTVLHAQPRLPGSNTPGSLVDVVGEAAIAQAADVDWGVPESRTVPLPAECRRRPRSPEVPPSARRGRDALAHAADLTARAGGRASGPVAGVAALAAAAVHAVGHVTPTQSPVQ